MHLLTLTERTNLGSQIGWIEPGSWLVHDLNAFEIAMIAARGTATVSNFGWKTWANPDKGVLFMRSGAIGDLMMLMPVLAAWKDKTHEKVSLCCFPHHFPLFEGSDLVDELVPYPMNFNRVNHFMDIISMENTMEADHEHHATDVFAKALGINTPLANYRPVLNLTEEELAAGKKEVFGARPTVAVQMRASVANRDYPAKRWLETIVKLEERGWGVVFLAKKGQLPPFPAQFQTPFIRDLSILDLTIRQSAAVLANCDAFLGVDSGFSHIAHALDIPSVGLYGPFPWQIRVAANQRMTAISGKGDCAGCCWHTHNGNAFPPNKPCSKIGVCVVLDSIEPDRICAKMELLKPEKCRK